MALLNFWLARRAELLQLLEQHIVLVLVSTGLAVAIGIPAGILAAKRPRLGRVILLFANIAQTVPSLALLGFILPLPFIGGIGPRTALVALSIYALLPVVRHRDRHPDRGTLGRGGRGGGGHDTPAAPDHGRAPAGHAAAYARGGSETVVVGSKNFTEQVILGELVAQAIEAEGGVRVVRKLNLGGTFVCDRGLRTGDLDVYVEYTGTAVTAVFHEPVPHDSTRAFERARELYARQSLTATAPLGFNNTFTILVRGRDARTLNLRTVDDLQSVAGRWTPGFGYEFLQRDDGYPGLVRTYGLQFASQPRAMDLSLIYRALADGQVDVIAGDATSALIKAFDLTALEDSRRYFPPYDAVPIVRSATLLRHPAVGRALARLAGRVTDDDMRTLNAAVDVDHQDVRAAVQRFLETVPDSTAHQ
ncbi:MAG: glycine/betaine ABC transporter substrate-binding protein [Luteitalea sp.]|nr:glycine/betaine ABC transporter substrate-binding protein [Luteitalea sp.]